ncbi:MAG: PhzF family phenazine biosynthesis protein [Deltaproteobacteria bacterium]|nr:PhzF family phenazine biosynthesis protein [Deltaproteobacteria bacterium]
MSRPLWLIDAFTDHPFAGNPAAVTFLDEPKDDAWHHAVAAEMNQAETAFLSPHADGFGLRWFTPAVEVDLCGHATLASAHFLFETGRVPTGGTARFHTKSGVLTATRADGLIALDFPATPAVDAPTPAELVEALGVTPEWVGRSIFDVVCRYADAANVRSMKPDMARLARVPARGVIVTAPGDTPGVDFVSRFFGPEVAVPEDPVTGSAHCALGPLWAERLGKTSLCGYQASARGGFVQVEVLGARVRLGGRAVTVVKGELFA